LKQDYGDELQVKYVDIDDAELQQFPALVQAREERNGRLPLVLVGDKVKVPYSLSFSWIVNEFKELGRVA
jgi:hypothetical protein